jgi:hypothetical protein
VTSAAGTTSDLVGMVTREYEQTAALTRRGRHPHRVRIGLDDEEVA